MIGWIPKQILLPLCPFLLGALIRFIERGFGWSTFDPGELAFSLAMLCLLITISAARLADRQLADGLTSYFTIGLFLFAVLFTVVTLTRLEDEANVSGALANLRSMVDKGTCDVTTVEAALKSVEKPPGSARMTSLGYLTCLMSIMAVAAAVYCKHKYKLPE